MTYTLTIDRPDQDPIVVTGAHPDADPIVVAKSVLRDHLAAEPVPDAGWTLTLVLTP